MQRTCHRVVFVSLLLGLFLSGPLGASTFEMSGYYEVQGIKKDQHDIVQGSYLTAQAPIQSVLPLLTQSLVDLGHLDAAISDPYCPNLPVQDVIDDDAYLAHTLKLKPVVTLLEGVQIKANITAFDKANLDDKIYGRVDYERLGLPDEYDTFSRRLSAYYQEEFDSQNVFKIDQIWGEVLTPFGFFVLGRHESFTGVAYFIQVPPLPGWTFGLIWSHEDEDGDDHENELVRPYPPYTIHLDTDTADEDGYVLVINYEKDPLKITAMLPYATAGKDNADTSCFFPEIEAAYHKEALKVDAFLRYRMGDYLRKDSGVARTEAYTYSELVTLLYALQDIAGSPLPGDSLLVGGMFKDDWTLSDLTAYIDIEYEFEHLTPRLSLAYASGAEDPTQCSGYFEDDQTFGSWLMNAVSDVYNPYFETPVSNTTDLLWDPFFHDTYSFSNIKLLRLGAESHLTSKLSASGNFIWAQRASTTYLEDWNPEWGTINALNKDLTKIALIGQVDPDTGLADNSRRYKNRVDADLGWEVNAKLTYRVHDPVIFDLEGAYYKPGGFYETALENAFGYGNTGLKVEPTWGVRWITTLNF